MGEKETMAIRCPKCSTIGIAQSHGESCNPDSDHRYMFLTCSSCGSPILVEQDGFMFRDENGEWEGGWKAPKFIYPEAMPPLASSVPKQIAASYVSAQRCFHEAGEYTATAIMCRRTLEGICENKGFGGQDSLKNKIEKLRKAGFVDKRVGEWADDVLRELGNDAAHDVKVIISEQDALDALEFTRALIEYLYVFEDSFARFKERRQRAKATAAPLREED